YQNLNIVHDEDPSDVAIFGGDHIYKMDVRPMLNFHRKRRARGMAGVGNQRPGATHHNIRSERGSAAVDTADASTRSSSR
ncbi:MAG: hypothetical protein HC809_16905, partial [Gammaproteobacteria bacterium]|nr:hypothetical protein [Gammaproteobacteria bacterium]